MLMRPAGREAKGELVGPVVDGSGFVGLLTSSDLAFEVPVHKMAEKTTLEDELPRLRFALARAMWDSGRDRRGARALAARPVHGSQGDEADKTLRAQASAWLAKHRG